MNKISDELFKILQDDFDVPREQIEAEKTLDDIGVDSVATIELIDIVQERFGIVVADDEITNKATVAWLVNTIQGGKKES
ncbi:acyl carrier protein [Saccharomonospora sp. NPDC046836]|uniref:acyl carrier protein n=1 Tax=Saccharomonospora sp. NPDC046836 TaxID=3156921 RepID=UPI0033D52CEE